MLPGIWAMAYSLGVRTSTTGSDLLARICFSCSVEISTPTPAGSFGATVCCICAGAGAGTSRQSRNNNTAAMVQMNFLQYPNIVFPPQHFLSCHQEPLASG